MEVAVKKVEVTHFGDPEVLQLIEGEALKAGRGEVVVDVKAVGVNPVETYIRAGTYPKLPQLPYTPGGNAAGIISSCGEGVKRFKVGARVYTAATVTGAYASQSICTEAQVYPLPDKTSFEEGAAIGVPAATAWRALFIRGSLQVGERVLVHGGSGSVGQAAIQFAVAQGYEVLATAGTDRGCSLIEGLGAKAFNHNDPHYFTALQNAGAVDLIIEMLANKNLPADLELLAPHGRVVIVGSRGPVEIDPRATMAKETDVRGFALASASTEDLVLTHGAIFTALETEQYKPHIAITMDLAEASKSHQLVMEDGNCGKIILIP